MIKWIFYFFICINLSEPYKDFSTVSVRSFTRKIIPKTKVPKTCLLVPEKGPCRAKIEMYYFDPKSMSCSTFTWGGCQGNGNRFDTLKECTQSCLRKSDTISRPRWCDFTFDYGYCFGAQRRYYYDKLYRVCKETIYSGCGGNKNNFKSKEQCQSVCQYNKGPLTTRKTRHGSSRKIVIINPRKGTTKVFNTLNYNKKWTLNNTPVGNKGVDNNRRNNFQNGSIIINPREGTTKALKTVDWVEWTLRNHTPVGNGGTNNNRRINFENGNEEGKSVGVKKDTNKNEEENNDNKGKGLQTEEQKLLSIDKKEETHKQTLATNTVTKTSNIPKQNTTTELDIKHDKTESKLEKVVTKKVTETLQIEEQKALSINKKEKAHQQTLATNTVTKIKNIPKENTTTELDIKHDKKESKLEQVVTEKVTETLQTQQNLNITKTMYENESTEIDELISSEQLLELIEEIKRDLSVIESMLIKHKESKENITRTDKVANVTLETKNSVKVTNGTLKKQTNKPLETPKPTISKRNNQTTRRYRQVIVTSNLISLLNSLNKYTISQQEKQSKQTQKTTTSKNDSVFLQTSTEN